MSRSSPGSKHRRKRARSMCPAKMRPASGWTIWAPWGSAAPRQSGARTTTWKTESDTSPWMGAMAGLSWREPTPMSWNLNMTMGRFGNLTCGCFCSYPCKHQFAAMLQLKETLELIGKHYAGQYEESGYFAAVFKGTLLEFAIDSRETGHIVL